MQSPARAKRQQGYGFDLDETTSVRFPTVVRVALDKASQRDLKNRSNYIRRAVIRSLRIDGLLPVVPAGGHAGAAEEMPSRAVAE